MTFIAPTYNSPTFTCPHCRAISHQLWQEIFHADSRGIHAFNKLRAETTSCAHCNKYTFWIDGKMIFPYVPSAPMPHVDLPEDCVGDYLEAREIVSRSPRGAAALLRLVIQKLLPHIGGNGRTIDEGIANLVKVGLQEGIQKALDSCRIIGNNAVHPGEIDINDSPEIATAMFGLINFIVEVKISQPKQLESLYSGLPPKSLAAIDRRDKK